MAKLRHIAIAVPDIEKAARFYETTFGLERVLKTAKRINLSDGTMNLTLMPSDDRVGDPREDFVGLHHLGFVVEDVPGTNRQIEAHGGRPVDMPASPGRDHTSESRYWDPYGVMMDITTKSWIGTK